MAWTLINEAEAFGSGADVWVLPEPTVAKFSRQIELQLGFPFANWQSRPTQQRSETLLTWTDPSFEFKCDDGTPMVCPSAGRLPCQWVVFLPTADYKNHPMGWLEECQKIFQQLNIQSPRLWISTLWKEELLKARLLPVGSYCEYR